MKRLLPFILLLSACSPIRVKGDPSFLKMERLAVLAVIPGTDATCERLAESARSNIEQGFMAAGYRIVNRSKIDPAIDDFKLRITGAVTPKTASRLGQMLGAQGLVIPSCERIGKVDWRLKILDVETGKIVVNSTLLGAWPGSNEGVQKWVEKIKAELK